MKHKIIIFFILIVAFVVRINKLEDRGLYIDEKYTSLTSNGICAGGGNQSFIFSNNNFTPKEFWSKKKLWDYFEAVARGEVGSHIPYTLCLGYWTSVIGINDFSMRLPSVIFAILTILLLYIFVKENFKSEKLALLSAFILSIEPLHIALSMQARSYSLSIFLTLLATYLFFKIINTSHYKPFLGKSYFILHTSYIFLYTLVFSASLLNHYMNGVVFLGHGLYVLFFVRDWSKWLKLGFAAVVAGFCLFAWLTWGGGQWTFEFLVEKNRVLAETAKLGTMPGVTDLATIKNLAKFMYKIVLDLFLTTNGLYHVLFNFTSLYLALRSILSLSILSVSIGLLMSVLKKREQISSLQKKIYLFFIFIVIFPQLFLVYDAIKNGHTGNITQRYSAFAMPYLAILVATLLLAFEHQKRFVKYIFTGLLLVQGFFVLQTIKDILTDQAPKYTTRYGEPRIKNPYKTAADKIISTYQIGDTVIYPSYGVNVFTPVNNDADKISILDAQYTNVFLPKTAEYIQLIDINEPNKIIIKNKDRKIEIFDFQGDKYRY